MVSPEIKEAAEWMLYELESNRLEVCLIPCSGVHFDPRNMKKVRVAISQNCKWYRDFCDSYTSGRKRPRNRSKHDTLIKRRSTIQGLNKIVSGRLGGVYVERLTDFINEELSRGNMDKIERPLPL